MKLSDHVDKLRNLIEGSFNKQFARLGIGESSSLALDDDILGWLYESYNNVKKADFKASNDKIEYDKVSLQSQVYTPRWVVQFLVDNSLGKLYLEMYPDSEIKAHYKIANAPKTSTRKRKPLPEIKLIDPACGSGNFLLYAFDFFYALYVDQIENYGAVYELADVPQLIIENNLHGIDLDDRAIQLAQLGLYIKARKKRRSMGSLKFKVVSSDFFSLRSVYIENRERALINLQSDLANNDTAEAQNKKDKIFKQLKEIEAFKVKIDELLAEGYNPILDDGVGKNIAPLQKKKMIPYEVLNPGQLKKYLNADG